MDGENNAKSDVIKYTQYMLNLCSLKTLRSTFMSYYNFSLFF